MLDLDETLIHFHVDESLDSTDSSPGYYMIRPSVNSFLVELSDYFEIVIFTAAMPDYCNWIVNNIDRQRKISHCLYR